MAKPRIFSVDIDGHGPVDVTSRQDTPASDISPCQLRISSHSEKTVDEARAEMGTPTYRPAKSYDLPEKEIDHVETASVRRPTQIKKPNGTIKINLPSRNTLQKSSYRRSEQQDFQIKGGISTCESIAEDTSLASVDFDKPFVGHPIV